MLKQSDEKLFTALARATERRVAEFKEQDLASTAWALSVANSYSELLFGAEIAE